MGSEIKCVKCINKSDRCKNQANANQQKSNANKFGEIIIFYQFQCVYT